MSPRFHPYRSRTQERIDSLHAKDCEERNALWEVVARLAKAQNIVVLVDAFEIHSVQGLKRWLEEQRRAEETR